MSVQLQKLDGKEFSVDGAYQTAVAELRAIHSTLDDMPTPFGEKPIAKMQKTLDDLGVEKDSGTGDFLLSAVMQVGLDVAADMSGMPMNKGMMMAVDTAAHMAMDRESERKYKSGTSKTTFKRTGAATSMLKAESRLTANTNSPILRKFTKVPTAPKPVSNVQRKHLIEARQKLIKEIEDLQAYRSCGVQGVRMTADGTMYGLDKFVNKADETRKNARAYKMAHTLPVPKSLQGGPTQPFA